MSKAFLFFLLLVNQVVIAQDSIVFPQFSKEYWDIALQSSNSKKTRGLGAVIGGLVSLPAAIPLLIKINENPAKYFGLSLMNLMASGALAGHGFGSLQFAGEEKRKVISIFNEYENGSGQPLTEIEKAFYLHQSRKSKVKLTIFSDFIVIEGVIGLASGLSQFAMEKSEFNNHMLKPWRPTALGGCLIILGSFGILRSITNQRRFENAMIAENMLGNLSSQSWKKSIGITSMSFGTLTIGISIWQMTRMFAPSFGNDTHWYYSSDTAIPAFISTFTGGVAMVLYGFKAFTDYFVFNTGNRRSIKKVKDVKEPHLSIGLSYNKTAYGIDFIYRF